MGRGSNSATMTAPSARGQSRVRVSYNEHFEATEEARDIFMFGNCHMLALELHERTGWPLAGDGWTTLPLWKGVPGATSETEFPMHVFVIDPEGRAIDAEGCRQKT